MKLAREYDEMLSHPGTDRKIPHRWNNDASNVYACSNSSSGQGFDFATGGIAGCLPDSQQHISLEFASWDRDIEGGGRSTQISGLETKYVDCE
jgi:hypothetical protein